MFYAGKNMGIFSVMLLFSQCQCSRIKKPQDFMNNANKIFIFVEIRDWPWE